MSAAFIRVFRVMRRPPTQHETIYIEICLHEMQLDKQGAGLPIWQGCNPPQWPLKVLQPQIQRGPEGVFPIDHITEINIK